MKSVHPILQVLKQQLKAHGIPYRDVAQALRLSEASVKRLLNSKDISLERLEAIATLAHCSLSDLVMQAFEGHGRLKQLSEAQEQEIAADLVLLLIAVSVISGFQFDDLKKVYNLEAHTLIQKLAHLDRLRLLELQPNNRIRLLIDANFRWRPNGPIQQFFLSKVVNEFFASSFSANTEQLLVFNGLCSEGTNLHIQNRLRTCLTDIAELAQQDRALPLPEKHGNTVVLALRQWQFGAFETLKNS